MVGQGLRKIGLLAMQVQDWVGASATFGIQSGVASL